MLHSFLAIFTAASMLLSIFSYNRKPKNVTQIFKEYIEVEKEVKVKPPKKEIQHEFVLTEENAKLIAKFVYVPPPVVETVPVAQEAVAVTKKKTIDELWAETREQVSKEYGWGRVMFNNATYYLSLAAPTVVASILIPHMMILDDVLLVIGIGILTFVRDAIGKGVNYVIDYPEIYRRVYNSSCWEDFKKLISHPALMIKRFW